MKHVRLYQNIPLQINEKLMLDEYASRHLAKVLRFPQGQEITLFNGDGKNYLATLVQVKKYCEVMVHTCAQNTSESRLDITLIQGIAKGEKMDFLMQKSVELGVNRIMPIFSERCVVRLKGEKLQKRMTHWQKVIIGACEQSGRSIVPSLAPAMNFKDFVNTEFGNGFVLHHRAKYSLLEMNKVN